MAVLFMNAPTFDRVRHDPSFRRLQRRVNYPALVDAEGRIDERAIEARASSK